MRLFLGFLGVVGIVAIIAGLIGGFYFIAAQGIFPLVVDFTSTWDFTSVFFRKLVRFVITFVGTSLIYGVLGQVFGWLIWLLFAVCAGLISLSDDY